MNYLYVAIALLIVALIVVAVRNFRTKSDDTVKPQEQMVIIDEATDILDPKMLRKPKQMKSRPRKKK